MKRKLLNLSILICICASSCCIYKIICISKPYNLGNQVYQDTSSLAISKYTSSSTVPIKVNFSLLKKTNKDIIGWIYSKNTNINYPVVQGSDNIYYLKHLIDKSNNKLGTIFQDYRNGKLYQDQNTILYGHHMKDSSMFASLVKYKKQSYYDTHPVIYLLTPEQNYRIEIFSCYTTDDDSPAYRRVFKINGDYLAFLEQLKNKSNIKSSVSFTIEDHIVTLSTCDYSYENARYVVHGKLVPIG